ncbi:hypothetical protein Ddye_013369 [Dipteronia dyeriana]|uniref:Uncharacterized protein n=1 Tax=Dipteronia dyeriana TaxID=168575 RepID=A0AAD9X6E2_9ROSI|nr:hypothetical protein Ddye_013369 [Dipteronia dyeriana]
MKFIINRMGLKKSSIGWMIFVMVVMVLLTSWEVVSARELSERQSGTVKPSLHSKSASLRESPPAPAPPLYVVYLSIPRPAKGP